MYCGEIASIRVERRECSSAWCEPRKPSRRTFVLLSLDLGSSHNEISYGKLREPATIGSQVCWSIVDELQTSSRIWTMTRGTNKQEKVLLEIHPFEQYWPNYASKGWLLLLLLLLLSFWLCQEFGVLTLPCWSPQPPRMICEGFTLEGPTVTQYQADRCAGKFFRWLIAADGSDSSHISAWLVECRRRWAVKWILSPSRVSAGSWYSTKVANPFIIRSSLLNSIRNAVLLFSIDLLNSYRLVKHCLSSFPQ